MNGLELLEDGHATLVTEDGERIRGRLVVTEEGVVRFMSDEAHAAETKRLKEAREEAARLQRRVDAEARRGRRTR